MLRHPENHNLRLYYEDTFEGLPLMIEKGPFVREYLERLKVTVDLALAQYPRVLAFRADLRLPENPELPAYAFTNEVISRFFASFKAKIQRNRALALDRGVLHDSGVHYVWSREVGGKGRPHYHLLILVNRDAFFTMGRLGSDKPNMIRRMEEAWASALDLAVEQVIGLVHIPDNAQFRVDRGNAEELSRLFIRASYLCKVATKSYGDRHRSFDCSRGRLPIPMPLLSSEGVRSTTI